MKALLLALVLAQPAATVHQTPAPAPEKRVAVKCFKSGEQISGFNKICFYNCMGSTRAITISSTSLCPLSI